jgi:hypothetical protein
MYRSVALISLAIASGAVAQSENPGLGVNPGAEGATEEVTPGSGPNGYLTPPSFNKIRDF